MMRRMAVLRKALDQLGVDPRRLRVAWISASEGAKFAREVTEFIEQVRSFGPLRRYEPAR